MNIYVVSSAFTSTPVTLKICAVHELEHTSLLMSNFVLFSFLIKMYQSATNRIRGRDYPVVPLGKLHTSSVAGC